MAARIVQRTVLWSRRNSLLFHTTPSFRAPVMWFMVPISRYIVAVGARLGRFIWRRLPEESKKKRLRYLYGTVGLCLTGCAGYYLIHVEYLPLTKRYRLMLYSREEVCQLIRQELKTTEDGGLDVSLLMPGDSQLVPHSHQYYKTTSSIMKQITVHNSWCERVNDIPWRLTVVANSSIANAVSLPTGDIIVFTGMIDACHNSDELGLLLSHEMSHVILDHGVESISNVGFTSLMGLFFIAAIWFFIPSDLFSISFHGFFDNVVTLLTNNRHSRKLELEADKFGLLLASRSCFDPVRAIHLWQHLPFFNESDTVIEYFEDHPCNDRRFATLQALLPQALQIYNSSECKPTRQDMKSFAKSVLKIMTP